MNNGQWLKESTPIPQIIGIVLLGWALIPANPYGYYIFLRIVVCGIFTFLAVKAYKVKYLGWVWVLAITAALYNPIIRVPLNREMWSVINIGTIGLLVATVFVLRIKNR